MFLLFFALWVIFNGKITLEICLFGIVISAAVFAFTCRFMDYSIAKETAVIKRSGRFIRYCCVLVKEIVKANFAVMHMILSEREEIEPRARKFSFRYENIDRKSVSCKCDHADSGNDHSQSGRR